MAEPLSGRTAIPSIDEILARPPVLHGEVTHGLVDDALRWIDAQPRPLNTLETGCGISTVVFAARGDRHRCITPAENEAEGVRAYCEARNIDIGGLRFEIEQSEAALPALETGPLDLVLIDGSHAFPTVFMDWFYTARHLRIGGALVIDDVHLWTGKILRDFLVAEPEWELVDEWVGRTVAFRRLAEAPYRDWYEQKFVKRRSTPTLTRMRMSATLVRRHELSTLLGLAREYFRRP